MKNVQIRHVVLQIVVCCALLIAAIIMVPKAYAVTYDSSVIQITHDSGFTSITGDSYSVKGGFGGTTKNITLKNLTSDTLSVSLKCTVSLGSSGLVSSSSVKFGSISLSDGTQTTSSIEIAPNASVKIAIKGGMGGTTTFTLSEVIAVKVITVQVGFATGVNGAYTVSGVSNLSDYHADSSKRLTINSTAGITVNANAPTNSNYVFFAWAYNVDGGTQKKIVSYTASTTLTTLDSNGILYPVYVLKDAVMYWVNGVYYDTWTDAFSAAGTNYPVAIAKSGTLSSGTYTIGQNQKLLIPFDTSYTQSFGNPTLNKTATTRSEFRKLTLASGAKIVCNGDINVNAQQFVSSNQYTGYVTGPYGVVKLNSGASIELNNNSNLYAYGFVSGAGSVIANSGSTVHELFQIQDWRGGKVVSGIYGDLAKNDNKGQESNSFVFSQYYAQNVESELQIAQGADLIIHVGLAAGLGDVKNPFGSTATMIGNNGLFKIKAANGTVAAGSVTRRYNGGTDRMEYNLYGNTEISSLTLQVTGLTDDPISLNSANYVMNIQSNFDIIAQSGTLLTIGSDVKLLPEACIQIDSGAEAVLSSGTEVILYDLTDWTSGTYTYTGDIYPIAFAYGKTMSGSRTLDEPSKLIVNGSLTVADGGAIYSTKSADAVNNALMGTGTITFLGSENTGRTVIKEVNNNNSDSIVNVPVVNLQAPQPQKSSSDNDYSQSMDYGLTYHGVVTDAGNFWYNWKVTVQDGTAGVVPMTGWYSYPNYPSNQDYLVAYFHDNKPFSFTLNSPYNYAAANGTPITASNGTYTHTVTADTVITIEKHVAKILGGTTYKTLSEAVAACGADTYVKMIMGTTESLASNTSHDVYVDLAGETVNLSGLSGSYKVYFMDKSTDGFTDGSGRVIGDAAASVQSLTKHVASGITRQYVKVATDGGYAFPRVGVAVTGVGYTQKDESKYLTFQNTCRVPDAFADKLTDVGFVIDGGNPTWYKGDTENTLTASPAFKDANGNQLPGTFFHAHYTMPYEEVTSAQAKAEFGDSVVTSSSPSSEALNKAYQQFGAGG